MADDNYNLDFRTGNQGYDSLIRRVNEELEPMVREHFEPVNRAELERRLFHPETALKQVFNGVFICDKSVGMRNLIYASPDELLCLMEYCIALEEGRGYDGVEEQDGFLGCEGIDYECNGCPDDSYGLPEVYDDFGNRVNKEDLPVYQPSKKEESENPIQPDLGDDISQAFGGDLDPEAAEELKGELERQFKLKRQMRKSSRDEDPDS